MQERDARLFCSPDEEGYSTTIRRRDGCGMTGYTMTVRKASEYTKITISVRNDVAARARRRIKELGTNQSAWFNSVAEKELDASQSSADYIARIDATVGAGGDDTIEFAREAARRTLAHGDDTEW